MRKSVIILLSQETRLENFLKKSANCFAVKSGTSFVTFADEEWPKNKRMRGEQAPDRFLVFEFEVSDNLMEDSASGQKPTRTTTTTTI